MKNGKKKPSTRRHTRDCLMKMRECALPPLLVFLVTATESANKKGKKWVPTSYYTFATQLILNIEGKMPPLECFNLKICYLSGRSNLQKCFIYLLLSLIFTEKLFVFLTVYLQGWIHCEKKFSYVNRWCLSCDRILKKCWAETSWTRTISK